jgi:hypothetical protein
MEQGYVNVYLKEQNFPVTTQQRMGLGHAGCMAPTNPEMFY